jgi:hypothetical protein
MNAMIPTNPTAKAAVQTSVRLIQPAQFDSQLGIPAIAITGTVVLRTLAPRTNAEALEINKALAEAGIN